MKVAVPYCVEPNDELKYQRVLISQLLKILANTWLAINRTTQFELLLPNQPPIRANHSCSDSVVTPSSAAFFAFDPASAPITT